MAIKPASLWADRTEPVEDVLAGVVIREPSTEELIELVVPAVKAAIAEANEIIAEMDREVLEASRGPGDFGPLGSRKD